MIPAKANIRWDDFHHMNICAGQLCTKRDTETVEGGLCGAIIGRPRSGDDAETRGDGNNETVLAFGLCGAK